MQSTTSPRLSEEQLDRAFGALADPTRRAILARLSYGDAGVLDVASPFPMSQPAVRRMCHLEPQRLKQLSDWVGSYREYWEESFERLDELLEEMQAPPLERTTKTTQKKDTTKTNDRRGEGS